MSGETSGETVKDAKTQSDTLLSKEKQQETRLIYPETGWSGFLKEHAGPSLSIKNNHGLFVTICRSSVPA